jgi:DNA-binding transcriptional MerR regulator
MANDGVDDEGLMTIEDLSRRADTATSTVRMYQSRGLLPPPERHGRIGYYGAGHLARLRLIAQLQQEGYSLASIKRLTEAWETGRGLADVLGLEAQVAAWAPEEPLRLKPRQFAGFFSGQKVTPKVIRRAVRLGLIRVDGPAIVVPNPRFVEIGRDLAALGVPVEEILDEFEALQAMAGSVAERFTKVFERHMWDPFVAAGLPADQVRPLTEALQRLSGLAEDVVQGVLRDALRRQAGDFLAAQAGRLEEAGVPDGLRDLAEAAGLTR